MNFSGESIYIPPVWCGAICRNAMNEICVEQCSPKRDCSGFDEKPNLKLADMPRYPKTKDMTKEEKFTSLNIYLAKVVDHLQGAENEQALFSRDSRHERIPIITTSAGQQIKDILSGVTKEIFQQPIEPQNEDHID